MQITKASDYGARSIVYLAKQPPQTIALVSEIASREGLPESYLAKILQTLQQEDIVNSHRGAKGGYSLARPASEISLREIFEALEGPIALSHCLEPKGHCEKQAYCAMRPILAQAQKRLLEVLEQTSMEQLARQEAAWPTAIE